jgi:hypothetical protein
MEETIHTLQQESKTRMPHRFTGDSMQNKENFKFGLTLPVISSLFDDVKHKILSPLSCLREFDNHRMLEFDLPMVNKKDIKISFDGNTPCD